MPEVVSQPGGAGTERTSSGPLQSENRRGENFEPTQDEQTVVADWLKRVSRAEDLERTKKWREDLDNLRKYERGAQTVDAQKSRTNMVYATIAAMMPELYAKNPTIAVSPTDAVPQPQIGKVKRFGATADKVISKMLVEEGKLKKRAKANIRAACVTSFGVLKVIYQKEYRGDPIAVRRIEDAQDNLARIESLVRQLKKTDDPTELAKKRDTLKANLTALTAGNEVKLYKGFTVDRMKSEDFLLLDDNVSEFDDYVEADALGHKIWMSTGDARTLFQMNPHGATRYNRPRTDANQKSDDTPADEQFICVIEIWDKKNGVIRTTAKGMNRWLREPYAHPNAPQRWYPFYVLGFNLTEGDWRPISDVELLRSLQDEYDRTRQNYADAREKSVPVLIFRKSGELVEADIKNITDRKNKDTIGVEGNPSAPLTHDLMWFDGAKIDPQAYDVSLIRNDMDLVSGRSDASRANLIKPKTATEAEIMQEAMQSRVGERRDTHEDMLSEMGEACLEIALRDLTVDEVRQLAGADAEWPQTPQGAEEVFRMVSVKVRAGSSGKPNMQKEREQWGQLMPVISDAMKQVAELRSTGNYDAAEAVLELLRETLRRYDEHLDLDAIIPPLEKDENGNPIAQQQAAMQLVQAQQQLATLQEELAKCQQDLQKAQAGEQSKIAEANAKATATQAQAREKEQQALIKAQGDKDTADRQAVAELGREQREAETERQRIAAEEARHQRELDAKVSLDKHMAVLKGAVDVLNRRADATAKAATAAGEQLQAVETAQVAEQKLTGIVDELKDVMATLTTALEQLGKDAKERTALVKEHLLKE